MTDALTGVRMDGAPIADRTDPDSDELIAERHRQLRGSDALRYYPPADACTQRCGYGDNDMGRPGYPVLTNHQCFLAPSHGGDCVFSSECLRTLAAKGVINGIVQAAVTAAA